jgi:WD40 repeat protein
MIFAPDGGSILTASRDGTARQWDLDGKSLSILTGHSGAVRSAVFASDGGRILTASDDGTARLWDRNGNPLATLAGHTGPVVTAVFSRDGGRIVTVSKDMTARLWDRDGKLLTTFGGGITSARFSPDVRSRILTISNDETARLWDRDGRPLALLAGPAAWLNGGEFAPDGSRIITFSADGLARLWDGDGKLLTTLDDGIASAEFSPDGSRMLTVAFSPSSPVLRDRDGKRLATLKADPATLGVETAVLREVGECGYRATGSCRNWSHSWPCSTLAPHAKRSASSSGKMVGAAACLGVVCVLSRTILIIV